MLEVTQTLFSLSSRIHILPPTDTDTFVSSQELSRCENKKNEKKSNQSAVQHNHHFVQTIHIHTYIQMKSAQGSTTTNFLDFLFDFVPASHELFNIDQQSSSFDLMDTSDDEQRVESPMSAVDESSSSDAGSDAIDFDQLDLQRDLQDLGDLSFWLESSGLQRRGREIWGKMERSLKRKREQLDDAVHNLSEKRTGLSSELRKNVDGIIQRVKKQQDRLERKKQVLKRQISRPAFVRRKDKFAFTLGVSLTIATAAIVSGFPAWLPLHYLIFSVILLTMRYFIYHSNAEHYYMIDFCYFSNFLMMFYLFLYPTSPELFLLNFANANGPLMSAVITWRNSLVFHDLDKITSVFIHTLPFLVTYAVRWNLADQYAVCRNEECTVSFADMILPHLGFFIFWQMTYFLKTEIVDRKKLSKRADIATSFRYLTHTYRGSKLDRLLSIFGPKGRIFMFMFLQMVYHLLTVTPVVLMYHYRWFHILCISRM